MKLFTAIAGVLRAQLFKLLDALRDGRLISGQAVAHADRFAVRLPDHVNDFKPGSRVSIVIAAGIFSALSAGCAGVKADTNAATTETIVLLRHGEKPPGGLGQLNCRGLNRALALPTVIAKQFGKPDAIFAPDPAETKLDAGQPYDYVRPLATIEPTAIAFGLPVDTSIGVGTCCVGAFRSGPAGAYAGRRLRRRPGDGSILGRTGFRQHLCGQDYSCRRQNFGDFRASQRGSG
jgi:hypothetical protein